MITFQTLSLKNFMSFGAAPIIINLDRPGTTLILGQDMDNTDRGVGANGVGKSTIINGLTYALFDKPISNISKDNLVNNINKKNMEVVLDFNVGERQYRVQRARKTKVGAAGNWVKLFMDGKDISPDSVGRTNAEIERIIGIPFELFVRIVAVSATHTPFLDLPVRHPTSANQTDIIEELFDLKTLSEKAVMLKEEIKSVELTIQTHELKIGLLEKEHTQHQKLIESSEKRVVAWQLTNDRELAEIERKLLKLASVDVAVEQTAFDELRILEEQQVKLLQNGQTLKNIIKSSNDDIKKAKSEMVHLDEGDCPYCLQSYGDSAKKSIELSSKINELSVDLQKHQQQMEDLLEETNECKAQIQKVQSVITVSNIDELYDIRGRIAGYEKQIARMKSAVNPHIDGLDELEAIELEPVDMTAINELKSLVEHQRFLLKLLTKKDSFVRKALLNKNIPFLNQRLTHYLLELGLPHTVEFTHEMTASISQFGRPMDFGNLSHGQRARVNLALAFAFRDVLQGIHNRINVCMLDEVLDVGLDAVGVQSAAKMVKQKARDEKISLFVISHRDEIDNAFDRIMTIQMSKGFSYLGEESE